MTLTQRSTLGATASLTPGNAASRAAACSTSVSLAPELFFRPDFISNDYTTPLPQVQASFLSAALYVAALSRDAVLDSPHQVPGFELGNPAL